MAVTRSSPSPAKVTKPTKQSQKTRPKSKMGKKNLKENPPSPTSPSIKRKTIAGPSKNTRGKRPRTVVENSDSDFELDSEFLKSPVSVKGKGKSPVKVLPSSGVAEEIPVNRIVEDWECKYTRSQFYHSRVVTSGYYSVLGDIKRILTENQLEIFSKSVFGYFLRIPEYIIHYQLLHCLLLREVQQPNGLEFWVCVQGKYLRFRVQKNYQGCYSIAFIADNLKDNDDLAVKLAVLYFVQCYLLGGPPGKVVSSEEIDVVDSGRYNEFGWGKHCFDITMHSLKGKIDSGYKRVVRSDEDGGYYRLLGFPLAIQFWFFECCPYVIGKLSLYSNVGIPRILNWPKLPKDKEGMVKMDVMNTLIFDRSLKELKLRNITPTSVERLSLSLTDFFSGETTPEAVKFKIKGGSKPAGQPGLMGSSSSSAHENVSRVEFEEFKKCLSVVVSQQGILMKSVAEMNKKLDILIESSQGGLTHNGSQSEDALRTSENEDDEDSTSEEDEDDKFDDDKGDDHHDDETDDDDDDLGGDGVGAGQDEAHTGDVRNDEGVVVPEVVSRDDDTGKVDDAKYFDPVEPIAEIKQPEQSQGGEDNIDVDATIASAVKAVENLIGSSTNAPAPVETYEKTDLEMVLFQETPILRPQKRDQKKGAVLKSPFIELASGASKSGSSSVSPDDSVYKVVKYVRGLCPLDNKIGEPVDPQLEAEFVKWVDTGLRKHKSNTTTNVYCKGKDTIFPPFRFGVEDISNKMWFHNLAYPNCFLTNSHIDIIFYYLRKKIMYSAKPKIKVTTTDCLFCSSITTLYEKFVEKNNDISVLSLSHNVAQYIQGGKILCATPSHLVDHVVMPINVKLQDHWICGRLNIVDRRIYLYNSLRSGRYMTAAKEACKSFSVILPYYFSMLDFKGLRIEAKFSTMEPFPIVAVDGLPEQVTV
ncbi:uncharacterized protein LOC115720283 [Cannabis sativa]|uniref:uncharacterized protein LOC115720283 n=1 Tax=Cannabis sativa TaxID=3483 RepID=UPI0029C9DC6D|nr:uncharacterized protein LOC115720283 [Cannabis sativa]